MARKKYQHYTEEFRREAVRRADQPGNTAASVAKELGCFDHYLLPRRDYMKGSGLCGTLEYEVSALDMPIIYCHCKTCRKVHAEPFVPTAGLDDLNPVEWHYVL